MCQDGIDGHMSIINQPTPGDLLSASHIPSASKRALLTKIKCKEDWKYRVTCIAEPVDKSGKLDLPLALGVRDAERRYSGLLRHGVIWMFNQEHRITRYLPKVYHYTVSIKVIQSSSLAALSP